MTRAPSTKRSTSGQRHLALVGPTASGKSDLAMGIARTFPDIELVAIDSMQVYRGMDIGTAKPTLADQAEVPHHLIDLANPLDEFSVMEFQAAAKEALTAIENRGHRALLVGGTALYLQAVIDDLAFPGQFPDIRVELEAEGDTNAQHQRLSLLDPVAASRMEGTNRRRVVRALEVTLGSGRPFSSFGPGVDTFPATPFVIMGIWIPRSVTAARIAKRVHTMLATGWLEEVRHLAESGPPSKTASQALGYRELLEYLHNGPQTQKGFERVTEEIIRRTRAFGRRQRVWFRRDPRIKWFGTAIEPSALLAGLLEECAEYSS